MLPISQRELKLRPGRHLEPRPQHLLVRVAELCASPSGLKGSTFWMSEPLAVGAGSLLMKPDLPGED